MNLCIRFGRYSPTILFLTIMLHYVGLFTTPVSQGLFTMADDDDVDLAPVIREAPEDFDKSLVVDDWDPNEKMTTDVLLDKMEQKLSLVLHYMDRGKLEDATLGQLKEIFKVVFDRRQLLRGEPTQIVSNDDRRAMKELFPLLVKEAKRRGLQVPVIEGELVE